MSYHVQGNVLVRWAGCTMAIKPLLHLRGNERYVNSCDAKDHDRQCNLREGKSCGELDVWRLGTACSKKREKHSREVDGSVSQQVHTVYERDGFGESLKLEDKPRRSE